MHSTTFLDNSPHFITEPLLCSSFTPEKIGDNSIRMAFAKAGQSAYNYWGEQAILTEEFLSRDYKTWEGGLVSINHEPNHDWVKAIISDLEYDPVEKLVIATFSGIPDWLMSLIYSADYKGTSQECIPVEYKKNSNEVIKGYGTGCTIVTDPYEPAANQGMGVGIPPALAAILASKYPNEPKITSQDSPYVPNNPKNYGISHKTWSKPSATSFKSAGHNWNDKAGQAFIKSCAGAITGDGSNFGDCHLFHHEENGDVNENGVNNALARLSQTDGIDSIADSVRTHLEAHKKEMNKEDSMSDKQGGGTPAITEEAFLSVASEREQLKSQVKTLESEKNTLETELASWKQKYTELESGEANRTKIAVESAITAHEAKLKADAARNEAIKEFSSIVNDETKVKNYLSTNPTTEQIKSTTDLIRVNSAGNVGSNNNHVESKVVSSDAKKVYSALGLKPEDYPED